MYVFMKNWAIIPKLSLLPLLIRVAGSGMSVFHSSISDIALLQKQKKKQKTKKKNTFFFFGNKVVSACVLKVFTLFQPKIINISTPLFFGVQES